MGSHELMRARRADDRYRLRRGDRRKGFIVRHPRIGLIGRSAHLLRAAPGTVQNVGARPVPALQQRLVWGDTVVRSRPPHMRLLTESRRRIVARNVRPTGFDDGRASAQNPESTSHHASSWRTA